MKLERLITIFDNETELLSGDINIDYIELNQLAMIFNPPDDDLLMHKIYEIEPHHIQRINSLLNEKIVFDLDKSAYYVECVQLPPYI